jgi:hypothetical protein
MCVSLSFQLLLLLVYFNHRNHIILIGNKLYTV